MVITFSDSCFHFLIKVVPKLFKTDFIISLSVFTNSDRPSTTKSFKPSLLLKLRFKDNLRF